MTTEFLRGKTVLVTGGTGSFGTQFISRLLAEGTAKKIIVFSRDELKQSEMKSSLNDPEGRMRYFLGDIRDKDRLQMAFRDVDYVIHAAALKRVPALEYDPFEAVKTNIIGTQNVISAALDQGVEKVVLVSTDKAANPANLYGATKLCAERLMVAANSYSGDGRTTFSIVRYGNVLGSRGSLLTIIENLRPKGVITVTHEEMTRFWITLDEGVDLVIHAAKEMHGGETYIPKIPVMKVMDFVKHVAPECEIEMMGIRPGEKIHEVLVTVEEARRAVDAGKHYVILPDVPNWVHAEKYSHLQKLPEGFIFSSDTKEDILDANRLNDLLSKI